MKREILFRGFHECENGTQIAVVNGKEYRGKWVFGYFWTNEAGNYFIKVIRDLNGNFVGNPTTNDYEVFPETVGQWTGLHDKNVRKMFEHDKLKDNKGQVGTIFYSKTAAAFLVNWKMKDGSFETDTCFYGEVIGNAFEVME